MKVSRAVFALPCAVLLGCGTGIISSPIEDTIGQNSWTLTTDKDNGLVDATHSEYGSYPNPGLVAQMDINVLDDGTLCASSEGKKWCGGPVQGIPYYTVLNAKQLVGEYCIRVVDIYGNDVKSGCAPGAPPASLTSPKMPDQSGGSLTASQSGGGVRDDLKYGTQLVIKTINDGLAKIGLNARVAVPEAKQLINFNRGDIRLGSEGACKDVIRYIDGRFGQRTGPGTRHYVFGQNAIRECLDRGSCRIGQLVSRAMAEACIKLNKERAGNNSGLDLLKAETGVVGGGGFAVSSLCKSGQNASEIKKCRGSPLVLDLAGDGLQLKGLSGGVSFSLFAGKPTRVGWLAGSDDALLAIDADGDGKITNGSELFGESTGGWAPHGFAALARHDDNHDGVISVEDTIYNQLLAWRDDGDGVSTPDELHSLASLGIRSIALAHRQLGRVDASGNEQGLVGAAVGRDGKRVPVVDVWFSLQSK